MKNVKCKICKNHREAIRSMVGPKLAEKFENEEIIQLGCSTQF